METKKSSNNTEISVRKMYSSIIRVACWLPIFMLVGCASSYDCYPCGRVSCNYCPPKPLPYTSYDSCNCNCTDSIGQAYLSNVSIPNDATGVPDNSAIREGAQPDFEPLAEETNVIPTGTTGKKSGIPGKLHAMIQEDRP